MHDRNTQSGEAERPKRDRDFEAIVQAVVQRLRTAPIGPVADRQAAEAARGPHDEPAEGKQTVYIQERVVTARLLEQQWRGAAHVVTRRDAVVTPAARDFIQQQGAHWTRSQATNGAPVAGAGAANPELVFGLTIPAYDPTPLLGAKALSDLKLQRVAQSGLTSVTAEMGEEVALSGKRGVLLTCEAAAAVCLANRRQGVRAVHVRDVGEVEQAISSLATNFLVIQPHANSTWQLIRMMAMFAGYPPTPCPDRFHNDL